MTDDDSNNDPFAFDGEAMILGGDEADLTSGQARILMHPNAMLPLMAWARFDMDRVSGAVAEMTDAMLAHNWGNLTHEDTLRENTLALARNSGACIGSYALNPFRDRNPDPTSESDRRLAEGCVFHVYWDLDKSAKHGQPCIAIMHNPKASLRVKTSDPRTDPISQEGGQP